MKAFLLCLAAFLFTSGFAQSGAAAAPADTAPSLRKIILVFKAPEGSPPPEGTVEFSSLAEGYTDREMWIGEATEIPVYEGRAELVLPAPNKLDIRSGTFPRHALEPRKVDIPAGAEPLTIDLEVQAAGSLHIRLTDSAGAPLPGWSLNYHQPNLPPGRGRHEYWATSLRFFHRTTDAEGRFIVTGLPLDTDCQVLAMHDSIYALSPVLRLTAAEPLRPLEWSIPAGEIYRGRLVGPDNAPMAGIELELSYKLIEPFGSGTRSSGFGHRFVLSTDARGEFQLPINFDIPGEYSLVFESRKDWQPLAIKLERDAARERQTVRLQRGHTLSGRLLDAETKKPVPDIELHADYHWGSYKDAPPPSLPIGRLHPENKTDAEGRFRFSNLPPGHLEIRTFDGDLETSVVTVPMSPDAEADLLIKRR